MEDCYVERGKFRLNGKETPSKFLSNPRLLAEHEIRKLSPHVFASLDRDKRALIFSICVTNFFSAVRRFLVSRFSSRSIPLMQSCVEWGT